jgi:multidrug efflux pump subunit AcrA (membrane-fusion protein)
VNCTRPTGLAPVVVTLLALVPVFGACSGGSAGGSDAGETSAATVGVTGVPVRVDTIRRMDLDVLVTAPGRTEALQQDRVRSPFASHLVSLSVTDGDHVRAGQVVAEVVSKDSEAALEGAHRMLAAATSAQDSTDAERAIEVAKRQLVLRPLRAPADGIVLSHAVAVGDYLDEGEVLVTIAEAGAVFFNAQVTQGDLASVRPGEHATIDLPAVGKTPVGAVVQGILPTASSENLSAPVRLEFRPPRPNLTVGLFGTVSIVAGQHAEVIVVPPAAVLRDDVSGVSRVAVVGPGDIAHWVVVKTGIQQGDHVEIVSPTLPTGHLVITDGQVGLPDSARVSIQP